jgi:hypothetical protein
MTRKFFSVLMILMFILVLAGAFFLILRPVPQKKGEQRQTRIIIPQTGAGARESVSDTERMVYEESIRPKVTMGESEAVISVLTQDFDGDQDEEQIVAYRNLTEIESPVYIAYIDYDEAGRIYRRLWDAGTAATRPSTISLYAQDLIGDRGNCVIVTGMNGMGERTMTVFRSPRLRDQRRAEANQPFTRIAELRIDGSISIQEMERPQAYQLGMAPGQSFKIAAYGHDYESGNILDQVEISYEFNTRNGLYEQTRITRVPGSQIEQRRLRELLSGSPGVFEEFISDLWYYVSPEGTLDSRQYVYFDPSNKELIFYGDETQQVFTWQNSTPTRYGLYIASQNISVTTLRRFLDIELESLDSIRLRVFEDVRMKIGISNSWDGSYRRAGTVKKAAPKTAEPVKPYIDAIYDSSIGKIRFSEDGVYDLSAGETASRGRYAFFLVNDQELLELRPERNFGQNSEPRSQQGPNRSAGREVFRVTGRNTGGKSFVLSRIRLGAAGIQDLREAPISLIAAEGVPD